MKLVMILVPSECLSEVRKVIESHDTHAYTEVPSVLGSGRTGRKLGTRAFPGTSSMILAIVKSEESAKVLQALRDHAATSKHADGIRAFSVPAESVI